MTMLLTRCPTCYTTFRITADLLVAAGGQARCGRCNRVFDAVAGLSEESRTTAIELGVETEDTLADTDEFFIGEIEFDADGAEGEEPSHPDRAPIELAITSDLAEPGDDASSADHGEVAEVADAVSGSTAPEPEDADTISPEQVHAVLEPEADADADADADDGADIEASIRLLALDPSELEPRPSRAWSIAAAIAAFVLALQLVNHARGALATHPIVGPILQKSYAAFGISLVPRWDIAQYKIVDWVAAAQPKAEGQGTLRITARIENRGPLAQPYPKVRLDLTDRWENRVGSRVFEPAEYLAATSPSALMSPGSTVEAALNVVDPGPDAYGFELDVCIDAADDSLVCATDQVFR